MKFALILVATLATSRLAFGNLRIPSFENKKDGQRKLSDNKSLELVGNNGKPTNKFPLGLCEGDCDNDRECMGNYKCFDNNNAEYVPGCDGKRSENKNGKKNDYCYDPNAEPQPADCADFMVLPGRSAEGDELQYAGLTYRELSQKWWESFISDQFGEGPLQAVPGVHFLQGNSCAGELEFDNIVVSSTSLIMAMLRGSGNIAFPDDPADYFETSEALSLDFLGIENASCLDDRTEIGGIGVTTKVLADLDLEMTFLVDGCPLDPRFEFHTTGAQAWPEIAVVPSGSIGHHAGYYVILPPLKPGSHTIVLSSKTSSNAVQADLMCELQSTFHICVGTEAECAL